LNWNALPVPKLAVDYVHNQLDPFTHEVSYTMDSYGLSMQQVIQRRALFRQRLDRYAQAGVKYITSKIQPITLPFTLVDRSDFQLLVLMPSQRLGMAAPFTQEEKTSLTSLSVVVSAAGDVSDGKLAVAVCNAGECAQGASDLATAGNITSLAIDLDRPLAVARGDVIRIIFEKQGGIKPIAFWTATLAYPTEGLIQTDAEGLRSGTGPLIVLRDALSDKVRLVHKGINFNTYELSGVQPYFYAEGCSLTAISRDVVKASCPAPSRLTRLELAMPGWLATVDGAGVNIERVREAFQEVALPKGDSTVRFTYMPAGMRPAILASLCTLAAVVLVWAYALARRLR